MKYTDRYSEKGLAMLKAREAEQGVYHVGDWRFMPYTFSDVSELWVMYNYDERDLEKRGEDFSTVIAEVKKYGYNVDADFLKEQFFNIRCGLKQNRFLPDRSGMVFSPIRDNGVRFIFSQIYEHSEEYVC